MAIWTADEVPGMEFAYSSHFIDKQWTTPVELAGMINKKYPSNAQFVADRTGRGAALLTYKVDITTPLIEVTDDTNDLFVLNLSQDGTWGVPTFLGKENMWRSTLATNDDGAAIVASILSDYSGPDSRHQWKIWTSQYKPDAGWSAASDLVLMSASDGLDPKSASAEASDGPQALSAAINRVGRAMVVWMRRAGVFAAEVRPYPSIVPLEPSPLEDASALRPWITVGCDDYDRSFVAWLVYNGTHTDLHARRFVNGEGWGELTTLDMQDGTVVNPNLAVDKKGNAMAVWAQSDGTTMAIWYNRYELGEGWSGPRRVEMESTSSNASAPTIAMDEAGNVLAAWVDVGAVRAARYKVGLGWEPATQVSQDEGPTRDGLPDVHLSISPSGVAMATWRAQGGRWFSYLE